MAAANATERATPLGAVCTAVRTLEADPQFDAVLDHGGRVGTAATQTAERP